jgi:hypothetical protein
MCEPPSKSSVCAWWKSIGYRFFWRGLSFYSVLFKLTPNNTKNGTKLLFINISKISFTKDFQNEFFFTCLVFLEKNISLVQGSFFNKGYRSVIAKCFFLEHLDDQETKRKKNVEQEKKTKVE